MPTDAHVAARSLAILWNGDRLSLLDQRVLPAHNRYVECARAGEVAVAIRDMVVRGAPAIGIAAAYGVALAVREHEALPTAERAAALDAELNRLAAARPTAVNLGWALARLRPLLDRGAGFEDVAAAAEALHDEDVATNRALARLGASQLGPASRVLTHCNTGPLATGGVGTALGVIVSAWRAGKLREVRFTETRPWLQGARLTAWELATAEVPATLMTESAAGGLAARGEIDWLIVGADRIAANGDVVNKVGTAPLAELTHLGGGRLMVVAPFSTVDLALARGSEVTIEQRAGEEVWRATQAAEVPAGIAIANPAFDVTPAQRVDCLVTERGLISPSKGEFPGRLEAPGMVK
ncbi:MAG: S-methyl-5-thioribose-1-phosphate isomerase [Gammaproteobacteria bacterium]